MSDPEEPVLPEVPEENGSDGGRGRVQLIEIEQEVQRSYIDYAMSVIVGRALPDARDGLKPVHRRILFGMDAAGMRAGTPYKKCARIVGDVMGKYHPHGDSAIYDALARMAQPFAMRHPLIDGQGNFGSADGHPPAAMRYTECRLAPLAMEMLRDLDEDTVDMIPNYDGEQEEPVVLPGRFPNLLVNGSTGIAVGMATNMPPHNLGEAIDAVVATIEDPEIDLDGLMKYVKGPDFPNGAQVLGLSGIRDAYATGRGSVRVRAKAEIEETKTGRQRIVITELPYMVSGDRLLEKIKDLTDAKKIVGISDGRNETNRLGTRIVLELRKGVVPQVVLNNLYKHTQLQDSFGIIQLALVDGVPRVLTLKQLIEVFIGHQREVVRRRTEFRLRKAQRRLHIVDGLLLAIDHIDEIIALIRASDSAEAAKGQLMARYSLSDEQAEAILQMRLRALAALERDKLRQEAEELRQTIAALQEILGSDTKLMSVIKEELLAIREKFANPRRTVIAPDVGELAIEDLIADEDVIITITRSGYVKRVKASTYRTQGRGGRGVIGAKPKEGDIVNQVLTTTNHAYVLVFSSRGKVYRLRAHEIPEMERTARGVSIRNLLPFTSEEQVTTVIDTRDFETHKYLVMATRKGIIKRSLFSAYDSSRRDGLIALNVRPDDELIQVRATSGSDELIEVSRKGMAICFPESDVRPMGRTAGGVIGIRLNDGDEVVAFDVVDPNGEILIVTDNGYGKRTLLERYPRQRRGGKGVRTAKLTHIRGSIQGAGVVRPGHEIFLISSDGQVIRMTVKSIARQGRGTTGVRMMRLDPGVTITGMAPVAED